MGRLRILARCEASASALEFAIVASALIVLAVGLVEFGRPLHVRNELPGDLQYAGRAGSTGGCTQIIANTVTFTGNSEVKSDCQAAGTRTIATNQLVRIVE